MNYLEHYYKLIERARTRALLGYSERHHIIPRCLGGDNDARNIVRLTPEEHFVAHQLLVKLNPNNKSLAHAAMLMCKGATGNKAFGWLRRKKSAAMLGNKLSLGIKASPETRAKLSEIRRGNKNSLGKPNRLGKKHSEESKQKIRLSLVGRKSHWIGKKHSEATKAKIASFRLGKPLSAEIRKKMSEAHKARFANLGLIYAAR